MADSHADAHATMAYYDGKAIPVHESHHHILPLKTYFGVFGALIVLTVVTVLVSYADLGAASLPVAMFVALIKAGLVVGFFMHLKYDDRFNAFVFFATILFVSIFFMLTLVDITTRDSMQAEWGNKPFIEDKIELNPDYKTWRNNFRQMDTGH